MTSAIWKVITDHGVLKWIREDKFHEVPTSIPILYFDIFVRSLKIQASCLFRSTSRIRACQRTFSFDGVSGERKPMELGKTNTTSIIGN